MRVSACVCVRVRVIREREKKVRVRERKREMRGKNCPIFVFSFGEFLEEFGLRFLSTSSHPNPFLIKKGKIF